PQTEAPLQRLERSGELEEFDLDKTDSAQKSLLYIEDNLSNLRLIERIFERRPGIKLITAMQGEKGLELAREYQPDLVLLDVNLPDMSGTEVLRLLREEKMTSQVPVVVVSAD